VILGLRPPPPADADDLTYLRYLQHDVISRRQALRCLTAKALRHRLDSGRWQTAHPGVYLAHTGPITSQQRDWVAVLAVGAGRPALLAGISALGQLGMRGYHSDAIHVLLPARRQDHNPPSGVIVHRSRALPAADIHRLGTPPCTMPPRSLVDAAAWAPTDDRARAIIAAGFQQRLVTLDEIHHVLHHMPRLNRRRLIGQTATDAAGGSESVSEMDFLRLCRRGRLPTPTRQAVRTDSSGKRRYLDAYFEEWGVQVEIDGGQHTEVSHWWADMRRQNDLWIAGTRVLRFPAWAIRNRRDDVIAQLQSALIAAGWRSHGADRGPQVPLGGQR
jgi:very-short-patch-repair endonuclease